MFPESRHRTQFYQNKHIHKYNKGQSLKVRDSVPLVDYLRGVCKVLGPIPNSA